MKTLTLASSRRSRKSDAQARWATPRRPERFTYGPRVAAVAKKLGTSLMPWQQQVVDVGLEVDPDTGHMAYREIVATVMRQSGKTTMVLAIEADRGIMWDEPQRIIYTAQTGSDARKKLLEDQVPILRRSKLSGLISHIHRAQGNENIAFKNGSRISVAASSHGAGHGFTIDLGVLDEFWEDEDDRREQAMLPAMSTRPDAQLLLTSTMGTEKSIFLNRKVDTGRHAATVDKGSGIAYFEWSLPLDVDIANPEVWWDYMPALGWTISEAAVSHAFETMEEVEWRRAYGNQPTRALHDRVIPAIIWDAAVDPAATVERDSRHVCFGVDVLPDRSAAAVVASDGKTVELIEHRAGTGWIVERMQSLRESWGGSIAIDGGGPAESIADDLELAGLTVDRLANREVVAACACMYDALADGKVKVRASAPMTTAVEGLMRRPIGDRFVWSRSTSLSDITPFMAATLALDRAMHAETPPEIRFFSFD